MMPRMDQRTVKDEHGSAPIGVRRGRLFTRVLRRVRRAVAGFFGLLLIALAIGFAWFIGRVPTTEPATPARADGIVALTGGASRVSDAVELLAAGHAKRLLITGVHRSASPRDIVRHVPEFERIFACCVDLDRTAVNTLGNATEARRWARSRGFRSLIVVTSAYHMPRAMAELGHQLPEVKLIAFPVITEKMRDGQWWSNPATARLLISEYVKYVYAVVRMTVGPDSQGLATAGISANVSSRVPSAGAQR
jgi:uncharacterized SAM-binding protein YcdF (DUF218 family)